MTDSNPSNPSECENTYPAQAKHFGGVVEETSPKASKTIYIGAQYPSIAIVRNDTSGVTLRVALPDARCLGEGMTDLVVFADSLSSRTVNVVDAAGSNVVNVTSNDVARFALVDNSTAGGSWRAWVRS